MATPCHVEPSKSAAVLMRLALADLQQAGTVRSIDVVAANGFWGRFKGLMFTPTLPHGLLLLRCRSVHTCFMRYALDVVYLDAHGRVTKLVEGLKPWRASVGDRRAVHALELGAGSARALRIDLGDRLVHVALQTSAKDFEP